MINQKFLLKFKPNKRPISAVADNIAKCKKNYGENNKNIKFNLLYDSNRSLQKIKIEQIKRNIFVIKFYEN